MLPPKKESSKFLSKSSKEFINEFHKKKNAEKVLDGDVIKLPKELEKTFPKLSDKLLNYFQEISKRINEGILREFPKKLP